MEIQTDPMFRFLQVNYKYGSLDKMGCMVGEVLDELMQESGVDMEDLVNRVEAISDKTLDRAEKLVPFLLKFVPLLSNEFSTRLQSKLLDVPLLRRWISLFLKHVLAMALGLKGKDKETPLASGSRTTGG